MSDYPDSPADGGSDVEGQNFFGIKASRVRNDLWCLVGLFAPLPLLAS